MRQKQNSDNNSGEDNSAGFVAECCRNSDAVASCMHNARAE